MGLKIEVRQTWRSEKCLPVQGHRGITHIFCVLHISLVVFYILYVYCCMRITVNRF